MTETAVATEKVFEGKFFEGEHRVYVNGNRLPTYSEIANHSPDGFSWGYSGSGPAQLALAILCEIYSTKTAQAYYQKFKDQVISKLPQSKDWTLTESQIQEVVDHISKNAGEFQHAEDIYSDDDPEELDDIPEEYDEELDPFTLTDDDDADPQGEQLEFNVEYDEYDNELLTIIDPRVLEIFGTELPGMPPKSDLQILIERMSVAKKMARDFKRLFLKMEVELKGLYRKEKPENNVFTTDISTVSFEDKNVLDVKVKLNN